jgi:D-glycero-alpha-D-manno-heptose-7-phosphate kinase
MIITKCPLRISLVGGSTDLKEFIELYNRGSVISFPCDLYTYITLHANNRQEYIINYSKNETFTNFNEIKNDVVREVSLCFKNELKHLPTITISFKSDIFSVGSGLAASSSYMIALIKAISMYVSQPMSDSDICKLAIKLERNFNPLTGYQDVYGCGISSFKRIDFVKNQPPRYTFYDSSILKNYETWLLHTDIQRKSTNILKNVDVTKSVPLLAKVEDMHKCLTEKNLQLFVSSINSAWEIKKETSSKIVENVEHVETDISKVINKNHDAYKLCGAGGGGYFLIFASKHHQNNLISLKNKYNMIQVNVDDVGVVGIKI